MRKMFVAAALAALAPATAHAAAFTNGGFETGSVDPAGYFVTLGTGSTAITGWTVIGNSIDYVGGYWQAAEGQRSIDLNGDRSGGITQTFDTIADQRYVITFSMAGNPDAGPDEKVMSTIATGNSSRTYTFDTAGSSRSNMKWVTRSYSFIADGGTTTLTFQSDMAGAYGPALDGVTLSVPEPATWALMILGFGAVGGAMRRRQAGRAIPRLA